MSTDVKELAIQLAELFACHPELHGRSELTGQLTSSGKHEARSWTEKSPLTPEHWINHINGTTPVGCFPLRPDGTVRWCVLDVDVYQDPRVPEELINTLREHKLPMIPCRSKSAGIHLYWFFKEDIPAREAILALKALSGFLGQGSSEIFPKQESIGQSSDDSQYGNWINMPYSGQLRYACDPWEEKPTAIPLEKFIQLARERSMTRDQLQKFKPPETGSKEPLPDGPPCLNHILQHELKSGQRDVTLFNVAVYLKKAGVQDVTKELKKLSSAYCKGSELSERQLDKIGKSVQKKDYRYQCGKTPLSKFCNSHICRKCRFGIGEDRLDPDNRSLIQVRTSPPIWYIELEGPKGPKRIALTTDELNSNALFNKRVMEEILIALPPVEPEEWWEIKNRWLQSCQVVDIPEEATPVGQLKTLLSEFAHSSSHEERELLSQGKFFNSDNQTVYFRLRDLQDFLERRKFKAMKQNELLVALKKEFHCDTAVPRIQNSRVRCWQLPVRNLEPPTAAIETTIEESPI